MDDAGGVGTSASRSTYVRAEATVADVYGLEVGIPLLGGGKRMVCGVEYVSSDIE
jgi:hypothetical protein